jgi:hypothetical protein
MHNSESGNIHVDIFIRSYRADFPWLVYCLRSIAKFAKGFGKVHICVPVTDVDGVPVGTNEEVHFVNAWEDDYLGQQSDKLYADMYCNAPYILCLDSDCIFTKEIRPEDLFVDGKPVWLYEKVPSQDTPWTQITHDAIGWEPEYEFMRRHPFLFERQALRDFRNYMFNRHNKALNVYIKERPYRSFSEFNAYGAWCYKEKNLLYKWLHPSEFHCIANQEWSWGGLTEEIKVKLENILAV